MMKQIGIAHLLLKCVVALVCTALLFGAITIKSSHAQAAILKPAVTCSGSGCDGLGPSSTGCWTSNLRPLATATIVDAKKRTGILQLWYSPVCQTNWGQVVGNTTCNPIGAVLSSTIERKPGVDGPEELLDGYIQDPGCVEHTPMIWAPDVSVQLIGIITEGDCGGLDCAAPYGATITQPGF